MNVKKSISQYLYFSGASRWWASSPLLQSQWSRRFCQGLKKSWLLVLNPTLQFIQEYGTTVRHIVAFVHWVVMGPNGEGQLGHWLGPRVLQHHAARVCGWVCHRAGGTGLLRWPAGGWQNCGASLWNPSSKLGHSCRVFSDQGVFSSAWPPCPRALSLRNWYQGFFGAFFSLHFIHLFRFCHSIDSFSPPPPGIVEKDPTSLAAVTTRRYSGMHALIRAPHDMQLFAIEFKWVVFCFGCQFDQSRFSDSW